MISNLCTTAEFSIEAYDGDNLNFRVEIFEFEGGHAEQRKFRVRVWRYEAFRLLRRGSASIGDLYDHTLLVVDDHFDGLELTAESAEVALAHCVLRIRQQSGK